jgi:transposase
VHRRHRHPGGPGRRRGRRRPEKKVEDEPVDHALGRSRGGFGTKVHLVCDGNGIPLAAVVTPGQRHESTQFEAVLGRVRLRGRRGRPRCRPVLLAGDKGYSYPRIRRWLARHGVKAVIPRRKDQRPDDGRVRFDEEAYRRRSVVEQCVGLLKECRAVATRFDKLAVNYLATVQWAMVQRYLRLLTA